ncbi:MAK10-like protein [Tanacetum coccineum]
MGDENPCRTLGDYSQLSHEGYQNTIEVPNANDLVPLRTDTIRLVQNGWSFHGLRSEDPNQHLKDFLKIVDSFDLNVKTRERTRLRLFQFSLQEQASNWLEHLLAGSISTWEDLTTLFLAQLFPPGRTSKLQNDILMRTIDQATGGKLRDKNNEESWALLEDLALYDNESWNEPRDFAKLVKAISMPLEVPSTFDLRMLELEDKIKFNDSLLAMEIGKMERDDYHSLPRKSIRKAIIRLTDEKLVKTDIRLALANIKEDEKKPFILGTPFFTTARAEIKFDKGKLVKLLYERVLEWEERIRFHLEKELEFEA